MKFTCESSYLKAALSTVAPAISSKASMPVLRFLLIEAAEDRVTLTGYDEDMLLRCVVPATVESVGTTTVEFSKLKAYISTLDKSVVIEAHAAAGKLKAKSGTSKFEFQTMDPEDYPAVPDVDDGQEFSLPAAELKEMLRLTTFAVAREISLGITAGVLFEVRGNVLGLVATDTHRLAWNKTALHSEVESPTTVTIPAKPLVELERILKADSNQSVAIRIGKAQVQFVSAETTLQTRILNGLYPNYARVIPQQFERKVMLDPALLAKALDRVQIAAADADNCGKFSFGKDGLTVSAQNNLGGASVEEIPATLNGGPLDIYFNVAIVREFLKLFSSESEISLEMNSALKPAVLRFGDNFLGILMPRRGDL